MLLDYVSTFCLFFTHTPGIIGCFILFLCRERQKSVNVLILVLFTLIFNPYLKSIWQVPLFTHLGEGWAFPSGHMQLACVFYGWIALQTPIFWVRLVLLSLLGGVGFSLVHGHFHTYMDVGGALFFAGITLGIYHHLVKISWVQENLPWMGVFLASITLPMIAFYPKTPTVFMLIAQISLMSVSLSWVLWEKMGVKKA